MAMQEEWRNIKGFEGLYMVSNFGKVLSLYYKGKRRDKIIGNSDNGFGYKVVVLTNGEKRKRVLVHRLVYETFVGAIPSNLEIDHINTNRSDNRLDNLRMVTHETNCNNKYTIRNRINSEKEQLKNKILSERFHLLALSRRKKIVQINDLGQVINEFDGIGLASRLTGIPASNICLCCQNKRTKAGGFYWCYKYL